MKLLITIIVMVIGFCTAAYFAEKTFFSDTKKSPVPQAVDLSAIPSPSTTTDTLATLAKSVMKAQDAPSSPSSTRFEYRGYIAKGKKILAIVNGEVHGQGECLDIEKKYILKQIRPTHIVVLSTVDNSESIYRLCE